ncbi:protein of unknown function DUF881 [Gottschalkia purinilytica]|uniref:Division initiation protein n=1 Tax=Gottschalkia purinilytica TaxID=1503 RepID=A0A0L0W6Q0_GOTPU|nr:DUF881 domain-containing protein [Gottschalkia purinilytica]KNF07223.1 protein of unknown function DUF881 [Gottschalkia purinilytica]
MIKTKDKIVFLTVCAVLGMILAFQFKTVVNIVGYGIIPNEKAKELSIEYNKLQDEKDKLNKKIEDIDNNLKKHQKTESEKSQYLEGLYKNLEKYKMFVGYEDVKGKGIVIEINDPPMEAEVGDKTSSIVANYDLILQIITILNDLGAEAISINGQRYTNYTEFEPDVNNIKINGVAVSPPFIISAIGDPDEMERGLHVKRNVVWQMENELLYDIRIKKIDDIKIPKYTQIDKFKYAKPHVEDSEEVKDKNDNKVKSESKNKKR